MTNLVAVGKEVSVNYTGGNETGVVLGRDNTGVRLQVGDQELFIPWTAVKSVTSKAE